LFKAIYSNKLLDAFKETHEKDNMLALLNNRLKGLNNWLENKVKSLEEELNNTKIDFENLEIFYKRYYCKCADIKNCENCDSLQKKVQYLVKTLDMFSRGQSNLEAVLGSQNCVFRKTGLGYNPSTKHKSFISFFKNKEPMSRPL